MSSLRFAFPHVVPKLRFVEYCKFYGIIDKDDIEDLKESFRLRGYRIKEY